MINAYMDKSTHTFLAVWSGVALSTVAVKASRRFRPCSIHTVAVVLTSLWWQGSSVSHVLTRVQHFWWNTSTTAM